MIVGIFLATAMIMRLLNVKRKQQQLTKQGPVYHLVHPKQKQSGPQPHHPHSEEEEEEEEGEEIELAWRNEPTGAVAN